MSKHIRFDDVDDYDYCDCYEQESSTEFDETLPEEEDEESYSSVRRIWREKMEQSQLFLPSEIEQALPIWMKFIVKRCEKSKDCNAADFYFETAELAAQKLRYYSVYGWECLVKDNEGKGPKCTDFDEELAVPSEGEESASSVESSYDVIAQVEFLLRLVTSSDFSFFLAKAALSPKFKPNVVTVKAPYQFQVTRNYLKLDLESMEHHTIRTNLLQGHYDDYILPLAMANEVNDQFWESMEKEYCVDSFMLNLN